MIFVDHFGQVQTQSMAFGQDKHRWNETSIEGLRRFVLGFNDLALASGPGTVYAVTAVGFGDLTTLCLRNCRSHIPHPSFESYQFFGLPELVN